MAAAQSGYADPDIYPVDDRGVVFTFAFFTPKRLGEGQFYLMVAGDKAGRALDGAGSYRLTVPADAPVRQYWSATVYDRRTHALIREMPHAARSSQSPGLEVNADGSVDLTFGPEAPAGKEANWSRRAPMGGSRSCSVSTAPSRRCSRRPGCCPTSRRRLDRGGGGSGRSAGVRVSARAFIVGAARSGSGKTSVAVGLMRALRRRGLVVRGAKSGPDYIDPGFHAAATGAPGVNLDSWAMAPGLIDRLAAGQAAGADVVVIESAMGLFDGIPGEAGRSGAAADLARRWGVPVILVLDVSGQSQTVAAIARGFATHDPGVQDRRGGAEPGGERAARAAGAGRGGGGRAAGGGGGAAQSGHGAAGAAPGAGAGAGACGARGVHRAAGRRDGGFRRSRRAAGAGGAAGGGGGRRRGADPAAGAAGRHRRGRGVQLRLSARGGGLAGGGGGARGLLAARRTRGRGRTATPAGCRGGIRSCTRGGWRRRRGSGPGWRGSRRRGSRCMASAAGSWCSAARSRMPRG